MDELETLKNAIKKVITQQADHLCWLDTYVELGKLVGIEFNPLMLEKEHFINNCNKFYDSLKTGCPYAIDNLTAKLDDYAEAKSIVIKYCGKFGTITAEGKEKSLTELVNLMMTIKSLPFQIN